MKKFLKNYSKLMLKIKIYYFQALFLLHLKELKNCLKDLNKDAEK